MNVLYCIIRNVGRAHIRRLFKFAKDVRALLIAEPAEEEPGCGALRQGAERSGRARICGVCVTQIQIPVRVYEIWRDERAGRVGKQLRGVRTSGRRRKLLLVVDGPQLLS